MTSCNAFMLALIAAVVVGVWIGNEMICRALKAGSVRGEAVGLLVLALASISGLVVFVFLLNGRLHRLCVL